MGQAQRTPTTQVTPTTTNTTAAREVEDDWLFGNAARQEQIAAQASSASTDTPVLAAAAAAGGQNGHGGHGAGILDRMLGLDPNNTFVESAMRGLGYGQDGVFGRSPRPGEGDGTTILRGLGAAAMAPVAGVAAVWGHVLDEVNHAPAFLHGLFDR